jgi:hypothetical protein
MLTDVSMIGLEVVLSLITREVLVSNSVTVIFWVGGKLTVSVVKKVSVVEHCKQYIVNLMFS